MQILTLNYMRRHTIGTRFPENQIAVVDRIATSMSKRHRLEVSRSDIVRMCVERVLPKLEAEHLPSRGR